LFSKAINLAAEQFTNIRPVLAQIPAMRGRTVDGAADVPESAFH
jgi:hypothetical protein